MSFDSVLEDQVGAFGRWQIVIVIFVLFSDSVSYSAIPQLANLSPQVLCSGPWFEGWSYESVANITTWITSITSDGNETSSPDLKCHGYDLSSVQSILLSNASLEEKQRQLRDSGIETNVSLERCRGPWVYDEASAPYRRSLIQSFNMVCDRKSLIPTSSMFFVVGTAIGIVTAGQLSDRYGRRKILCGATLMTGVLAMILSFTSNIQSFLVMRLLLGIGGMMHYICLNVFLLELTNHKHRNTVCLIMNTYGTIFQQSSQIIVTYLLQDWQWLHFVHGAYFFLYSFLFIKFLPETPRWLSAKGRYEEALKTLKRAAVMNGKRTETVDAIREEDIHLTSVDPFNDSPENRVWYQHFLYVLRDWYSFLSGRESIKRWVPLSIIWMAVGGTYFGLWFYGVRIKGNPYLVAFVMNCASLPSYFLNWVLLAKIDRKKPLLGLLLFSCLCGIASYIVKLTQSAEVIIVVLATVAISCVWSVSRLLYLITPELFPTLFRAKSLGLMSSIARVGVIGGLFAERFEDSWPLFTFSVALAVAFVCSIFLPRGDYKTMTEGSMKIKKKNLDDEKEIEEDLGLISMEGVSSQRNRT